MLKVRIPKIILMILTSFFCLHLSGLTVAEDCWDREGDREGGSPTVTGNHTYTPEWYPAFQYDPNNPDEIDRSSSETISIIGGTQPYTWLVSGNGFSLSEGATEGLTNTLIANYTACGSATIAVADKYGDNCTGYVRCTAGSRWFIKTRDCVLPGLGTLTHYACDEFCNRAWSYELIVGNKKQTQTTVQYCGDYDDPTPNCIDPVHNPPERVPWDCYADYSGCADPIECEENCPPDQDVTNTTMWNYEWECL